MARTRWPPICEPRPLPQARQIGPAAPVGAKAGVRPTERYQDNPRRRRPIRRSGRTQARPYAHTTENPRKQGRTTIHILPADSGRPTAELDSMGEPLQIVGFCVLEESVGPGKQSAEVSIGGHEHPLLGPRVLEDNL